MTPATKTGSRSMTATPPAPPVLALVDVVKRYGEFEALRGVTLCVEQGELLSIVGPSGSGKSTLLQIMGTLDRATSGSVVIDGHDVASASEAELAALRAQRIGFIFQRFFLLEAASTLDNVCDGLLYMGTPVEERRERAAEALRQVGLEDRISAIPATLSGGERQRVAIARALVSEPAIILADEPTGNLDTRTSEEIIELLQHLNGAGSTIIVVTHDLEVAGSMRRQISVRDGEIEHDTGG
jgi:putative ABC transport system ATP-binding protein